MTNREIATEHLSAAARGLDLSDSDNRATFRTRLADSYKLTKITGLRTQAKALGHDTTGDRQTLLRRIADGYING